jgi:hypothetical protein
MKNQYLELHDETDDFGFTTHNESDIISPSLTDENTDLRNRLAAVSKIFMPLLENLAKNPQQEIIKWPNRGPIIQKQIETLKQLTEVTVK